jgi:hypothetical protein
LVKIFSDAVEVRFIGLPEAPFPVPFALARPTRLDAIVAVRGAVKDFARLVGHFLGQHAVDKTLGRVYLGDPDEKGRLGATPLG